MSAFISTSEHGYTGCNFCGIVKCHNANLPSIIWVLCKECHYIQRLSGNPISDMNEPRTSSYTKPPFINRGLPDNVKTYKVPTDIFFWDTKERLPIHSNTYHLLDSNTKKNRLYDIHIGSTCSNYRMVRSMCDLPPVSEYESDY